MKSLHSVIHQMITAVDGEHKGCFVKLSCRSPKDLTFTSPKTISIYHKLMEEKLRHESPELISNEKYDLYNIFQNKLRNNIIYYIWWISHIPRDFRNLQICTLYEASLQSMREFSAQEALDMLLQSKRIAFDLELDVRFPEEFDHHVIVRPWIGSTSADKIWISEFSSFSVLKALLSELKRKKIHLSKSHF